MRKNGVNKTLKNIVGGICAPAGFSACGARLAEAADIQTQNAENQLALIVCDKRFPSAFVFPEHALLGAYAQASKENARQGYTKAVLLYSGKCRGESSPASVKATFRAVANVCGCEVKEVCMATVGEVGSVFPETALKNDLSTVFSNVTHSKESALDAMQALAFEGRAEQAAYAFELGDVECKIGAIYKSGDVRQAGALSNVCLMTTDVSITPKMLQKALGSAVADTWQMLCLATGGSPSDFVGILASGKAENYTISHADTEYKKFYEALKRALFDICMQLALGDTEKTKRLICKVTGARSKRVAQEVAKAVACSDRVKSRLYRGFVDVEGILCAIGSVKESISLGEIQIDVSSSQGKITLFDFDGKTGVMDGLVACIVDANDVFLDIRVANGNYSATALTRIEDVYSGVFA